MIACDQLRKIISGVEVDEAPPEVFLTIMSHLEQCPHCDEWLEKTGPVSKSDEARAGAAVDKAVKWLEEQTK